MALLPSKLFSADLSFSSSAPPSAWDFSSSTCTSFTESFISLTALSLSATDLWLSFRASSALLTLSSLSLCFSACVERKKLRRKGIFTLCKR